jgi:hypothetical protein
MWRHVLDVSEEHAASILGAEEISKKQTASRAQEEEGTSACHLLLAECFTCLTVLPWRWRLWNPTKSRWISAELDVTTSRKTLRFVFLQLLAIALSILFWSVEDKLLHYWLVIDSTLGASGLASPLHWTQDNTGSCDTWWLGSQAGGSREMSLVKVRLISSWIVVLVRPLQDLSLRRQCLSVCVVPNIATE